MVNERQKAANRSDGQASSRLRSIILQQGWKRDVWLVLFLLSLNCLVFYKTVFGGKPISHAFLLANRDVLFRDLMSGVSSRYDESVYLMVLPYYHLAASYIRSFELPLWNSFAGWGQPFAGDIILSVWSPLRFVFSLAPSMPTYNLIVVAQIGLAATGTYLLARALRLSRFASIFAAISFAYCPFVVWFAELPSGTSTCFLPLLVWTFARLANRLTIGRALIAGVSSGIFILSGHPEVSFFGIAMGSLILLLRAQGLRKQDGKNTGGMFWRAFLLLMLAGISAFCVCSIVFIEFITYALNGCSYKFAALPSTMAWQAIAINILQPSYGGISPFAGTLCVPFLAVALLMLRRGKHYVPVVFTVLIVFFVIGSRPGFLAEIFRNTPVNWLPGTYCAPIVVLAAVLLAGIGMDVIRLGVEKARARKLFFIVSAASLILFLFIHFCNFDLSSANFENAMEAPTEFRWKNWIVNLLVISSSSACLLFVKNPKLLRVLFPLVAICGCFVSQAIVVKDSLPTAPQFHFKASDPVPFLQKEKERLGVIGFDVLSANDNAVFGIKSLSTHSPLVLDRYQRFMYFLQEKDDSKQFAAGRPFNTVIQSPLLSPRFDMSGVNYFVSLQPLRSVRDTATNFAKVDLPQPISFEKQGFKVAQSRLQYNPDRGDVTGQLDWSFEPGAEKKIKSDAVCNIIVSDENGTPYWYGGAQSLSAAMAKGGMLTTNVEAIVPLSLKIGTKFQVRLQIYDQAAVAIAKTTSGSETPLISQYTVMRPDGKTQYQPIYESSPHHVRVYRNTRSVGRAYIVSEIETAKTPEESLTKLRNPAFDPHRKVILEIENETKEKTLNSGLPPVSKQPSTKDRAVRLVSDKPNCVVIEAITDAPGMLVLTDAFYPGWKASIDGKATEIYRANFHFRAVLLPPGSHTVEFTYQPSAFYAGIALFALLLIGGAALLIFSRKRRKNASGGS